MPLLRVPVMGELCDVLHQTEELPLRLHLGPTAQREVIEPLVDAQIAEDWFHGRETPPLRQSALPAGQTHVRAVASWVKSCG